MSPSIQSGATDSPLSDGGSTVLLGLIGRGIQLSRSPAMHESQGQALGLRVVYRLFDTALMGSEPGMLGRLVDAAAVCGFAGLNITIPWKKEVIASLDELTPHARRIGAVNTVVFRDGRKSGHNTDVTGFADGFAAQLGDVDRHAALLIGAGGAGCAIGHALLDAGVGRLAVHDIDGAGAAALVAELNGHHGQGRALVAQDLAATIARVDGVVNASPVGMASHPGSPVNAAWLSSQHWVADAIYVPLETELIRAARAAGCRTMDGSAMAVHQAMHAFELFTGRAASLAHMQSTFDAAGRRGSG